MMTSTCTAVHRFGVFPRPVGRHRVCSSSVRATHAEGDRPPLGRAKEATDAKEAKEVKEVKDAKKAPVRSANTNSSASAGMDTSTTANKGLARRRDMVVYAQRRKHLHHPDLERAKCMEDVYHILARRTLMASKGLGNALKNAPTKQSNRRYMVGVVGSPGSGKSTLARQTSKIVNAIQQDEVAVVLPMDGYHYTRAQLDAFDDPGAAHARRGAHWTFDAEAFVSKVGEVAGDASSTKSAPTFDHGQGDPVENGVTIERHHSIVFVEGLYLLLKVAPWSQLREVFDETWYIDCDVDEAMRRVYNRMTRNGRAPRDARLRIETNDRPNAMQILEDAMDDADLVLPSLNFRKPYWR